MSTVRDLTYQLLREHSIEVVFGNPGSNELPFLKGFPADFTYVLGLHEGAVISMADGYAQASGRPTFVNLHAAAGTGNAMGGLTNAVYSHSPLVITAGQQVRSTVGLEVMLANVDAPALLRPLAKWTAEPLASDDVPRSISQAIHAATSAPAGPVYVSVPYDDWDQPQPHRGELLLERRTSTSGALTDAQLAALVVTIDGAERIAYVVGPDVDNDEAYASSVALAEALDASVWIAPSPGRAAFPTRHPNFAGAMPASNAGIVELLDGYDLVIVAGAPVFRYHQHDPGDYLPDGTTLLHLTTDPGEAARAPMGSAVIGDPATMLAQLVAAVNDRGVRRRRTTLKPDVRKSAVRGVLHPDEVFATVDAVAPEDAVFVVESTSTPDSFWTHVELTRARSYYAPAAGGLGFGLPAAVGVQLASPRPVVGIIGDGSANYGITALWTAARYRVPVVFLILKNGTYGALRGFGEKLRTGETPGMDIEGIDFVSVARGYGVPATAVASRTALRAELQKAFDAQGPVLIEVKTSFQL